MHLQRTQQLPNSKKKRRKTDRESDESIIPATALHTLNLRARASCGWRVLKSQPRKAIIFPAAGAEEVVIAFLSFPLAVMTVSAHPHAVIFVRPLIACLISEKTRGE